MRFQKGYHPLSTPTSRVLPAIHLWGDSWDSGMHGRSSKLDFLRLKCWLVRHLVVWKIPNQMNQRSQKNRCNGRSGIDKLLFNEETCANGMSSSTPILMIHNMWKYEKSHRRSDMLEIQPSTLCVQAHPVVQSKLFLFKISLDVKPSTNQTNGFDYHGLDSWFAFAMLLSNSIPNGGSQPSAEPAGIRNSMFLWEMRVQVDDSGCQLSRTWEGNGIEIVRNSAVLIEKQPTTLRGASLNVRPSISCYFDASPWIFLDA